MEFTLALEFTFSSQQNVKYIKKACFTSINTLLKTTPSAASRGHRAGAYG